MKITAFALAAALGGMIATAPAQAASTETNTAAVHFKDLDLTTEEGQSELDRRIDKAARAVCGLGEARTGTRLPNRKARECYESALSQLNERVAKLTKKQAAGG